MSVTALLDGLLEEVRGLLSTDTAAVLLLDDSGEFLVASAARGIEEEVRQGSRVPLGVGFAGHIAAERRPVSIEEVSPATVVNPVLLYKGIKAMLGVPLQLDGELLGVMHIGSLRPRSFTEADTAALVEAADRAARVIVGERRRVESAAAEALQRSLSPVRLPGVPGLDLAARYVPGSRAGVGGDWYDVFELPHGQLGIVIGDVMGHGLRAATAMGRVRSALRANALHSTDPAAVLRALDRYFHHFEPELIASATYAVLDTSTWRLRIASAGHPAPLMLHPGSRAVEVDVAKDLLLGVDPEAVRRSVPVELAPGSLLCQFTDGLVERREKPVGAAMEQLHRSLPGNAWSAEAVCADIMSTLVGDRPSQDDVALLVVRRLG